MCLVSDVFSESTETEKVGKFTSEFRALSLTNTYSFNHSQTPRIFCFAKTKEKKKADFFFAFLSIVIFLLVLSQTSLGKIFSTFFAKKLFAKLKI